MSTQEQRDEKAFDEWAKDWWFDDGVDDSTRTACRYAWQAAEAAAIERCAKFMESRADEIAAADNCTANMMAAIYRDEAKSLRSLLPKEES